MNYRRILLPILVLCVGVGVLLASQGPEQAPSAGPKVRYDEDVVVRAMIRTDDDLEVMSRIAKAVWSHGEGIGRK